MPRGIFIAFEGIDGAGTTTQAERLTRWLQEQGRRVHRTREPSDRPLGKKLRGILRHEGEPLDPHAVALLFAADRIDHLRGEIEPALERGEVVLTDRYVLSSLAYQSVQSPADWVTTINRFATRPDLTILLRVSAEVGAQRVSGRGEAKELFDTDSIQRRVVAAYDSLAEQESAVVLDGEQDLESVELAIRAVIQPLLATQ